MAEEAKSLATVQGYEGSVRGVGVEIPTTGDADGPKVCERSLDRLSEALAAVMGGEIYKDDGGALVFGVRAGKYVVGDVAYAHAGCTSNLTDDATNYIYLTLANLIAGNAVTVSAVGFPTPSTTPHIPLGTIVAADGAYTHANIDNSYRMRSMISALPGLAGPLKLTLTGVDGEDGTGTMSIQVKNLAGVNQAGRFRIRVWMGTASYGAPVADTDFSVGTGTQLAEIVADADYEVITDATGLVVMDIDLAADGTVHVMAEIDGRIYTASLAITGNP